MSDEKVISALPCQEEDYQIAFYKQGKPIDVEALNTDEIAYFVERVKLYLSISELGDQIAYRKLVNDGWSMSEVKQMAREHGLSEDTISKLDLS